MKYLTENEIKFLKDTGLTPTVIQCGEWKRTCFNDILDAMTEAAARGIDFDKMVDKLFEGDDIVSLEYAAGYVLYLYFTKEQLLDMDGDTAIKFLQDFKYFCGWRKSDSRDGYIAIEDAYKLHTGQYHFTHQYNDDVWYEGKD